jgi:hypothetical protein
MVTTTARVVVGRGGRDGDVRLTVVLSIVSRGVPRAGNGRTLLLDVVPIGLTLGFSMAHRRILCSDLFSFSHILRFLQ